MLFVQRIDVIYTKAVRGGGYANTRRAIKFLPVEFDKADITGEILFDRAAIVQTPNGLKEQSHKTKPLGENAFFDGKFSDFFGERVFIGRGESGFEILYTDKKQRGYIKSRFVLKNGESGRIIYNERYSCWDSPVWNYYLTTFNFVCAEKERFKPKLFYIKEPDFSFNDMKQLRYSGF